MINAIPTVPQAPAYTVGKPDAFPLASGAPFTVSHGPRLNRLPTPNLRQVRMLACEKSDGPPSIVGHASCALDHFMGQSGQESASEPKGGNEAVSGPLACVTPFTISSRRVGYSPALLRMDRSDCRAVGVSRRLLADDLVAAAWTQTPGREATPTAPAIQVPCVSSELSSSNLPLFQGAQFRPVHGPDNSRGECVCLSKEFPRTEKVFPRKRQ